MWWHSAHHHTAVPYCGDILRECVMSPHCSVHYCTTYITSWSPSPHHHHTVPVHTLRSASLGSWWASRGCPRPGCRRNCCCVGGLYRHSPTLWWRILGGRIDIRSGFILQYRVHNLQVHNEYTVHCTQNTVQGSWCKYTVPSTVVSVQRTGHNSCHLWSQEHGVTMAGISWTTQLHYLYTLVT